jgi:hypothetical protein
VLIRLGEAPDRVLGERFKNINVISMGCLCNRFVQSALFYFTRVRYT